MAMIKHITKKDLYHTTNNLITSFFHFSIGDYYDEKNINFGHLRVLNDEVVAPKGGLDIHEHNNLEIITYIHKGSLTHKDSLNNHDLLNSGDFLHISCGKGIHHAEKNLSGEDVHLIRFWILPDKRSLTPTRNIVNINDKIKPNEPLNVIGNNGLFEISQDINLYYLHLEKDKTISFSLGHNKQVYLLLIEGNLNINDYKLISHEALTSDSEALNIKANENSNIIFLELNK